MSDKKIVSLDRAVSYKGVDYAPGINEMPSDAATLAVKRKFGSFADGGTPVADMPEDFKPLSYEDTFQRFAEGDSSSEVFDSLKFYQPMIKAAKDAKMSIEDFIERQKAAGEKPQHSEGLSEDLPMRHVFVKLGEKYDTDEKIKSLSRDDLIKINGIAEGSADKIIAYLAENK